MTQWMSARSLLSSGVAADLIIVVDAGRIVESGRHEMLLARNGLYTSLYRTQFREFERC
jgi:ABC-type multidrug transport system fused ATPase/permease subunit